MKKKCIFITGCNAVGKTSLARELIKRFGGISRYEDRITYCNDGESTFAGKYIDGSKYGGVDYFHETKVLEEVVVNALKTRTRIIGEGSYLNTFGLNLQRAMFAKGVEDFLLVNLFASPEVIRQRLTDRVCEPDARKLNFVLNKNRGSVLSARKWASIGVKVIQIDTGAVSFDEESERVYNEVVS